jgi:hypothetical protein
LQFNISEGKLPQNSSNALPLPLLLTEQNFNLLSHQENTYEDFYLEKNIPMELSAEGPKAAIGDVNGDKKADIYVCGAKGQAGQLYLQNGKGFTQSKQPLFEELKEFEDTAAEFFDADNDGDLDLFVGSGGNEFAASSQLYQSRLYFNDGKGKFQLNPRSIPAGKTNVGVVRAEDMDGDGDIDLFVGSRSVPQQFGVTPNSYIYENNGEGYFRDVTRMAAPELSQIGMVRDAMFADIDGDKIKELIVVGDWMTPVIFKLTENNYQKIPSASLDKLFGFWGSINVVDIDNDNDLDIVLGNIGENFSLKVDTQHPLKLWVKDFENNGILDKILTKTISKRDVPVFLKNDMVNQFPFLKSESLKHTDYANKSVQELFKKQGLDGSKVLQVNYLKSIVAVNDGKGNFSVMELPREVQFSCVNAIANADLNNDGFNDLILGGNFWHFVPQLGRLDACRGTVLQNNGKGKFTYLPNKKTGYIAEGEVKQTSVIQIKNETYLMNLINNAPPSFFKIN